MELFKGDAENHVQRIDHIPQGFAHFAAMRVTDHCVQKNLKNNLFLKLFKNLIERQLPIAQLLGHEHHAGNPKEEDVMAGLEQMAREKVPHVRRWFGPAHHSEWPHAGGEPRGEDVFVYKYKK